MYLHYRCFDTLENWMAEVQKLLYAFQMCKSCSVETMSRGAICSRWIKTHETVVMLEGILQNEAYLVIQLLGQ